jgi:hypothetical protein
MISHLPFAKTEVRVWQEAFLYPGSQLEVSFQGSLLVGRQMFKTEPGKRIADQPVGLDGLMADLAEAVGSRLHAGESGVDLTDEVPDLKAFSGGRYGLFQPKSPVKELLAKYRISGRGHRYASC